MNTASHWVQEQSRTMIYDRRFKLDDGLLYVMLATRNCLYEPPWGDGTFDCFVVNRHDSPDPELVALVASKLVSMKTDWIETFGPCAEELHDAIDRVSVEIGRQSFIGDGSPMTSWHDDIVDASAIADYVRIGGLGHRSIKALIVIGNVSDLRVLCDALQVAIGDDLQ